MSGSGSSISGKTEHDEREALRGYFEQYGVSIRREIERRIGAPLRSSVTADDIMQQSYLDILIYCESHGLNAIGAPEAWIRKIALNNLRDVVRYLEAEKRGGGRVQVQPAGTLDDSYAALYETVTSGDTTPSRRAARNEMRRALEESLKELPEKYRRTVELFALDGRSMAETADELGMSQGACYMVRSRAYKMLGLLLGRSSAYFSAS